MGASTEVLVVRRPARNQVQTHAPRRAVLDSHASRAKPGARAASCRCVCSPLIMHRASLPPSPAPSSSRLDTLQAPSLSAALATHLPLTPPSTPHLCVASPRACVRNGGRGAWRAPQKRPRPLLPPPRQPPLLPGRKTIDGPLSGPKHQNSSEKGRARSTRGAGGR